MYLLAAVLLVLAIFAAVSNDVRSTEVLVQLVVFCVLLACAVWVLRVLLVTL